MSSKLNQVSKITVYLEKTFSQNPSDVAHLLKYLYYSIIRFDTKYWYHFIENNWTRRDEDSSPLIPLMKNDLVNKYLHLANQYNQEVMRLTSELNWAEDLDSMDHDLKDNDGERKDTYLPLVISDLMHKSKICSELSLKLTNHGYYHKVNVIAQELFTQKDFDLRLDINPDLLGFENGNYDLIEGELKVPSSVDRVFMSVGYNYHSIKMEYRKEINDFFSGLGLTGFLPMLASLLSGNIRQPVVWIDGLNDQASYALSKLIGWTLGEYVGSLPFSTLRKRKIPHYQNHTHGALVESCRKRLILVEQLPEDYPSVYPPMIDTLLSQETLNLRKPYETTNDYVPQFGIVILSTKEDSEPFEDSMIFEATGCQKKKKVNRENEKNDENKSEKDDENESHQNESEKDDENKSDKNNSEKDEQVDYSEEDLNKVSYEVKEEWKYDFIRILFEYLKK